MGGKSSTSTSTVKIPKEVLARYNAVNARAEEVAKQPFQQYGGEFVAPLSNTQIAGINNINQAAGQAQPYFNAATGLTLAGAQDVGRLTPEQIDYYRDPAMLATVAPTLAALQQQQGQQLSQQQANAIRSGAFGGDRSGVERAVLRGQQNLATGQAIAPIYQQAYQTALQTATGQQGVQAQDLARRMQAGQQLAGLGVGAQQAALQGAQAQMQAGQMEQQTRQALDTAKYQQFLQERGYPFQVAQFLANIAMGTGALSGSTTTTTQPAGFFSDERLKSNMEPVGKLYDGQTIYRYDFGDGRTQLGLSAQETAEHGKPGVGLDPSGYLTVDYRDATNDAADAASQALGGAVMDGNITERRGFLGGGLADSTDMREIMAAMGRPVGMYGNKQTLGTKGLDAVQGYVPQASLPIPKMVTASPVGGGNRQSSVSQAAETGRNIAGLYRMGKEGLIGSAPTKDDKEGTPGLIGGQGKLSGKNVFTEFSDWMKKPETAATGGLIVDRKHYYGGGPTDRNSAMPYTDSALDGGQGGEDDILGSVLKSGAEHIQSLNTPGAKQAGSAAQQSGASQLVQAGSAAKNAVKGLGQIKEGFGKLGSLGGSDAGSVAATSMSPAAQELAAGTANTLGEGSLIGSIAPEGAGVAATGADLAGLGAGVGAAGETAAGLGAAGAAAEGAGALGTLGAAAGSIGEGIMSVLPFLAMFSDERMKHNKEQVGELFDGQPVYRYDFGDGRTQLGLMAQQVERHHPEAVAEDQRGLKMVDYRRATEDAADRNGYATRGLVVPMMRERHDGPNETNGYSNVVGEGDLPAPDAREVSLPIDKQPKYKIQPQNKEDMDPHWQGLIDYIYPREGGLDAEGKPRYNIRQGGKETFDTEGPHPGLKPAAGGKSSASGAAQFINATWNDVTGGAPMTKGYQDAATKELAARDYKRRTGRDLDADLREKGLSPDILSALKPTWAGIGAPEPKSKGLVPSGSEEKPIGRTSSLGDVLEKATPDFLPSSDRFWVPFLSFVGSTLASKNPTLGGALGEGIVGGVSGYQANREMQSKMAKSVLDILKDRFTSGANPTDSGKPGFYDNFRQTWLKPEEYRQASAEFSSAYGVPPEVLGLNPPKAPTAPTAPVIAAGQPQPSQGQPKTTETGVVTTTQPKGEGAATEPSKSIYEMSGTQLANEIRKGGDKAYTDAGLIGALDPRPLERDIEDQRRTLEAMRYTSDPSKIKLRQELAASIASMTDQVNKMYEFAVGLQKEKNLEEAKILSKGYEEHRKSISSRQESYPVAREALSQLGSIIKDYETGRASEIKSTIKSWADQFGLGSTLPAGFDTMPNDQAIKIAFTEAFRKVANSQLTRAPAATLTEANRTVAMPTLAPGAAYDIIGKTIGEMDYLKAQDADYLNHVASGKSRDPLQFANNWQSKNSFAPYVASAFSELPFAKGMNADQKMKLMQQHKFIPAGEDPHNYGRVEESANRPYGRVAVMQDGKPVLENGKQVYYYYRRRGD